MNEITAALDDGQAMRHAGRDVLSLALLQSRNATLAWLAALSDAQAERWAGQAAWFQERWIARHVERSRGLESDAHRSPLASIEPMADAWWSPQADAQQPPPTATALRAYLAETMDITQDLLSRTEDRDADLHWFRAALFEEDALIARFAGLAQQRGVTVAASLLPRRVRTATREPLWWPAQRHMLGSADDGFVPEAERWAHEVAVPEFEIDAQPVSWRQFAEFVADGGYDEPRWWSEPGAGWLAQSQRRSPRDVEELANGVVRNLFGRLERCAQDEPATGVTLYEAQAWCAWAGRRLPTEVEWELAACRGASRGFVWGDVVEWTAGRARAWPGGHAHWNTGFGARRGCAWFEPRRLAHPKARRFAAGDDDHTEVGFRTCAL
jgi:formylglycine-generating enzyme required for sulfatase activity